MVTDHTGTVDSSAGLAFFCIGKKEKENDSLKALYVLFFPKHVLLFFIFYFSPQQVGQNKYKNRNMGDALFMLFWF